MLALSSSLVYGQNAEKNMAQSKKAKISQEEVHLEKTHRKASNNLKEATFWSEDFSSGIPSSWTNAGFDEFGNPMAAANWEYRGTSTTPNNLVGSRGAFDNGTPIASPTANNGFIIFDSDYLDNGGVSSTPGQGPAPAPHVGTLTTPTINLTGNNNVELSFTSYHRYFEGRALIAFSTDGGTTWPDTLAAHLGIAVNAATATNAYVALNVSSIIGNQSNVKLRFIYDGVYDDPAATGNGGYYFWMIDDIELNDLPKHELRLTDWNGAPAIDMIFGPASGSSKMGILCKNIGIDEMRNMEFDANVYNYGFETQTNVKLTVDILDGNNLLISSWTSTSDTVLNTSDTGTYNTLNTYGNPFLTTGVGDYRAVYKVHSDSTQVVSDTFNFYVTDTILGLDFNDFTNRVGTPNISDDGSAIASRIDLVMPCVIKSVRVMLSNTTVAGGIVEVEVFDTTGFDFTAGFPATSLVAASTAYTITQADVTRRYFQVPVSDGINPYAELPGSSYFLSVKMFSNTGANPINIRNGQLINQPAFSSILYNSDESRWYSGFLDSKNLNAPHIRANISVHGIGVDEQKLRSSIKVGPNPASDFIYISFEDLEGIYTLNLSDITGRKISEQKVDILGNTQKSVSVQNLASGIYILNVTNGTANASYKISVQ